MPIASLRRVALGLALSLGLAAATSTQAEAAVIYDFSLPANGEVGSVRVVVTAPFFVANSGLLVLPASSSPVALTSTTPVDPDMSFLGLDFGPTTTLFGISLSASNSVVLLNPRYPEDFFVFNRTTTETGTFTSVSGYVESDDELDTDMPIATLVVSGTPDVPEPATMALLGASALGLIARRRRQ